MKPILQFTRLLLGCSTALLAQEKNELKFSFSGYLDTYYSYDFNNPTTTKKVDFLYNYNRQNEFNLNIGLLRAKVEYENVYGNLAIHSGTYVEDNYTNEKTKYLNEALVGLYLDKSKKQSVEVGILPSYIGFESATSASNLTLTRSVLAENSPYYMTGVKYNYKPSDQWNYAILLTNGWQKIEKTNKKALPSFGTQIVYKPSENTTLNWSSFIGDDPIGTDLRTRFFNNLYYDFKWKTNFRTIAGFDFGIQKKLNQTGYSNWWSPVLITQYSINSKWQTAFRAEYYQDAQNVMISSNNQEFKTVGASLNFDYLVNAKVKFRTEARYFDSKEKVFEKNGIPVKNNFFLTTSLSFEF